MSCYSDTPTPTGTVTNTPLATNTPTVTRTPTPVQTPFCNYLVNGDFETGSQSPWVTTTPAITTQIVTNPVNGGSYAIALTSSLIVSNGGSQGIQQDILNLTAGASYKVGAAVLRAANNIASARIRITWYPCAAPGTCGGTNQDMIVGNNSSELAVLYRHDGCPGRHSVGALQAGVLHHRWQSGHDLLR